MKTNFRKLSWGFLFILLDINIIFVDILPDFIGYLLILSALLQLESYYPGYKKGFPAAFLLFLLSFLSLGAGFGLQGSSFSQSPLWIGINGLHSALLLVLVYVLLSTFTRHAISQERLALAESSRNRMRFFCTLQVAVLVVTPYMLNTTDVGVPLIGLTILLLLAMISIFFLFRKAAKTFPANSLAGDNPSTDMV